MKTIIVIGKNGQLAWELKRLNSEHKITCLGREDIDITEAENLTSTLAKYDIEAIINASAYTAVDKAETDQEQAYLINETAVKNLAAYCKSKNIHLTHVSTDYVFDGEKGSPYKTDDNYNPQGVYGASKAAGEKVIQNLIAEQSCILRTSWVYSSHGNNFVKTMLRLMKEKPELGVIDDQIGSPTSALGLAQACSYAAQNKITGIHHWTDQGVASWYDFAQAIQAQAIALGMLEKVIPIKPIPSSAYPTPAKRPHYSVLDKSSLNDDFSDIESKHWQLQLNKVLSELNSQ